MSTITPEHQEALDKIAVLESSIDEMRQAITITIGSGHTDECDFMNEGVSTEEFDCECHLDYLIETLASVDLKQLKELK